MRAEDCYGRHPSARSTTRPVHCPYAPPLERGQRRGFFLEDDMRNTTTTVVIAAGAVLAAVAATQAATIHVDSANCPTLGAPLARCPHNMD